MPRKLLFSLAVPFLLSTSGCFQQTPKPQKTQLEMREMQSRTFPARDTRVVMKALINALQDEGFMVRNADKDLGFVSAAKDTDVVDSSERFWSQIFQGASARYQANSTVEASVNVSEFGRDAKVRVVFQVKIVDNFGMPVSVNQIDDLGYYQEFFSKVDKSLFIERQHL